MNKEGRIDVMHSAEHNAVAGRSTNGRKLLVLITCVEFAMLCALAVTLAVRKDWRVLLAVPYRGMFTVTLLALTFLGKNWARVVLIWLFFSTALLGGCAYLFVLHDIPIDVWAVVLITGISIVYFAFGWILARSANIKKFMAERRKDRAQQVRTENLR
jgi:hypothetical protein